VVSRPLPGKLSSMFLLFGSHLNIEPETVRKIQSPEQNFAIYCENGRADCVLPEQIYNKIN